MIIELVESQSAHALMEFHQWLRIIKWKGKGCISSLLSHFGSWRPSSCLSVKAGSKNGIHQVVATVRYNHLPEQMFVIAFFFYKNALTLHYEHEHNWRHIKYSAFTIRFHVDSWLRISATNIAVNVVDAAVAHSGDGNGRLTANGREAIQDNLWIVKDNILENSLL